MARNGSGTWTAPAGQPAVSGVAISSTAHNDLVTDVGTEITDSLSRSGKGAMLAPVKAVDGTVTAPGVSFDSATGTGLYLSGGGSLRHAILGTLVAKLESTGWYVNLVGSITAAAMTIKGAVADGAAAVGVILDNSVDLANAGAKLVSFRRAGVEKAYVSSAGKVFGAGLDAGSAVVSNVATPVATTDATTKAYVDGLGVKAWGKVTFGAPNTVTLNKGFNVASVTWGGTDSLTVTFTSALSDANYACVASWGATTNGILFMSTASTTDVVIKKFSADTPYGATNFVNSNVVHFAIFD